MQPRSEEPEDETPSEAKESHGPSDRVTAYLQEIGAVVDSPIYQPRSDRYGPHDPHPRSSSGVAQQDSSKRPTSITTVGSRSAS